jgi:hypothetical protein
MQKERGCRALDRMVDHRLACQIELTQDLSRIPGVFIMPTNVIASHVSPLSLFDRIVDAVSSFLNHMGAINARNGAPTPFGL